MPWTLDQKLDYLMCLPWTVEALPVDSDEGYRAARIKEIPDAIATGEGRTERAQMRALAKDVWTSLRSSLAARLAHGDAITLPTGVPPLPWTIGREPGEHPVVELETSKLGEAWEKVAVEMRAWASGSSHIDRFEPAGSSS